MATASKTKTGTTRPRGAAAKAQGSVTADPKATLTVANGKAKVTVSRSRKRAAAPSGKDVTAVAKAMTERQTNSDFNRANAAKARAAKAQRIAAELSKRAQRDADIVERFTNGATCPEVAKAVGMSVQRVRGILIREDVWERRGGSGGGGTSRIPALGTAERADFDALVKGLEDATGVSIATIASRLHRERKAARDAASK